MKKINDDLSINVLNIAAVEKRNDKCFLFMMDGDKYELTENDYDVVAAEIPTLKVNDNFYLNPNAVLTVETIYKNSTADHTIVKLVGDNVLQITLAEGEIVSAMEPTSGGGGNSTEVILGAELLALRGKHIDVDKLIALIQKYDVDNNNHSLTVGSIAASYSSDSIIYLADDSGIVFNIFGIPRDQGMTFESDESLTTFLTNNKIAIESIKPMTFNGPVYYSIFQPTISDMGNFGDILIPKQEILDLFVD